MKEIVTTIDIEAPVETVWRILADTRAYDEWNPFVTRVRGELSSGAPLDFMAPFGSRDVPIQARVINVEENHEIRWRGPRSAALGKVFTAEHYLQVEASPTGGTRLTHGETFSGLVPRLLWKRLEPKLRPLYGSMNDALKERAERLSQDGTG